MSLVVYADFNCPWSYLASCRVDALAAAGVDVDWRAVEHDPRLPVTGRRLDPEGQVAAKEELSAVAELLLPGEELPWEQPELVPNTEAAISGYAEAYGTPVAGDVRRLLFSAYWVDGVDIGDPAALRTRLAGPILRARSTADPLRESGFAVSGNRGPITTEAWRRIREWRDEWTWLGTGIVPTLVEPDRAPVTGAAALRRLADELIRVGAKLDPDLPDPARYPEVPLRPPKTWLSGVGGPWARAWMRPG
ncbi:MAG TPA: DsbA family protein [Natronosporangium sp.]